MAVPQLTCFSDDSRDVALHFQILCLDKQLFIWIGCNTAKFGHLFASIPTRYSQVPSVSGLLGGGANSTGEDIARRLALKTKWSIVLATNLPSNAPSLEAFAEKRLLDELQTLGYF